MGGGSPLEGGEALRPFRFPVGRTSNKLRGLLGLGKSWSHPGRVAPPLPRNHAGFVATPAAKARSRASSSTAAARSSDSRMRTMAAGCVVTTTLRPQAVNS
jgi:hypothetical protein